MSATQTTAPATPTAGPGPAPAPRQLRWLMRLHRPALLAGAALVLLTAAALLWLGGPLTDASETAWQQYKACDHDPSCSYEQEANRYKQVYTYTTYAVLAVPFLVAAWAGGSLTGRELESGTARLAWTQGVSPARWLASRLAFPAALILAATGLLALLHRLAWTTAEGRIDTITMSWDHFPTFYANGTLPVAFALAGLAAGVLAGLLLRRAPAALATGAVALGALWAAVHAVLPQLWPAATRTSSLTYGPKGWGIVTGQGVVTADGDRLDLPCYSSMAPSCEAALSDMGAVSFYRDLHPAAHYWPLQLVASGIVLAVAALLAYTAFRVLRHRTP
ncbi:ABC transporter permease [Streptomyces sp. CHD11]|uniref:ABC transporter permease n=1 Tax=Streptomyces sp. CHD11 TaxID=2741325 RepID=UPI001BFCA86F|nr:ABC transporter permease [Streptomyces sp. CHD11]MBT3154516.1 ABC transporter permease [Streptomyces sp. CHD11]